MDVKAGCAITWAGEHVRWAVLQRTRNERCLDCERKRIADVARPVGVAHVLDLQGSMGRYVRGRVALPLCAEQVGVCCGVVQIGGIWCMRKA